MQIYLATDHRGFYLKEKIRSWLAEWGHHFHDFGAYSYNPDDDYPDYVWKAAKAVHKNPSARAIVLGATGQGEAMVCNRLTGVRATVYYGGPEEIIRLSREHNNANVLSLGASFLSEELARRVIRLWLETPFSGDPRHSRRIQKLDARP